MLSQGWALLRAKGVRLAKEVDSARDHMRPALWTTFDKDGHGHSVRRRAPGASVG
jgi:hypothetical protein